MQLLDKHTETVVRNMIKNGQIEVDGKPVKYKPTKDEIAAKRQADLMDEYETVRRNDTGIHWRALTWIVIAFLIISILLGFGIWLQVQHGSVLNLFFK